MFAHELVKAKANATPDAIAIQEGERQVTYRELEDSANRLTGCLRRLGVPVGMPIGLFVQRSADLAIGALGIWQTGSPYVALDPHDPPHRLQMALEDSGCNLVVVQRDVSERLPAGNWKTVILDEYDVLDGTDEIAIGKTRGSGDLAYVIFTSGSTGRPKGVQITHENLLNLIAWHIRAFGITSTDQATMQASPGFDAAVWELWPYLVAGATVHIVKDCLRADPTPLRDWMVATGITISFLPTPIAESMVALEWPAETRLRYLLTGADVLRRFPDVGLPFKLVNNYGPTECTVVATSGVVSPQADPSALPSIGRPIANVQVYVVDEQLHQVPTGTAGELIIGGAGVGRGYINLPKLSQERFLSNSLNSREGGRLYRTGDRVRMAPDGQISFLGRLDQQIKLRGYRIEPGEIEAVMQRHPAIKWSAVLAGSTDLGDGSLIAYVVMNHDVRVSTTELRLFLSGFLPEHMVPARFIKLDELPLTTNGKIDRSSLPEPSSGNLLKEDDFEAPQSETECWLADFLVKMLGVPRISRNDNFFRLGGHSLLGAQLIAKIQQRFGVELSLRSLFDHPNVSGIASEISRATCAKLDAMSEDEARAMLESLSGEISA